MKIIPDAIKHLVVEDDEDDKKATTITHPAGTTKSTVTPTYVDPQPYIASPQYNSPFSIPSTIVQDENIYRNLLSKTNFDNTTVGQTVRRYYDALDGMNLDVSTRLRMAMKQATKLDNVTIDQVIAAFDSLKVTLQQEVEAFASAAESSKGKDIIARQNRITAIDDQTEKLGQEKAKLVSDLAEAQNNHATATQQFNMASQRRVTEIDQQRVQFTALLTK